MACHPRSQENEAPVLTACRGHAHRLGAKLNAGTVWINMLRAVEPPLPFGGFKGSGIGKEGGWEVVHDYTCVKSVCG